MNDSANPSDHRVRLIEQRLRAALMPQDIAIHDDSAAHAGHAGAASGGGHYNVLIVSEAFVGKNPLQRHRMVYDAVGDLMRREIHALSIKALTPDEF